MACHSHLTGMSRIKQKKSKQTNLAIATSRTADKQLSRLSQHLHIYAQWVNAKLVNALASRL